VHRADWLSKRRKVALVEHSFYQFLGNAYVFADGGGGFLGAGIYIH
jgi:hypothetical protein